MKNKIVKLFVLSVAVGVFISVKPTDTYAKTKVRIENGTVVNASDKAIYIRKSADAKSEKIGKLKVNSGAVKTGTQKGDWIEVTSGEIKGWLNTKDVITEDKLEDYVCDNIKDFDVDVVTKKITGQYLEKKDLKSDALSYERKGALQIEGIKLYLTASLKDKQTTTTPKDFVVIEEDGTRIRSKANLTDSLVYGLENKGKAYSYKGEENGFYKITQDGKDAYIKKDCAKKITKDVPLSNIANVDYIVNAMYTATPLKDGITRITIEDKDYYVSTDDVYFIYLKNIDCKATNIVGREQIYDLDGIGKNTYGVSITNPDSDTTVKMFMPKDDCYLEASFDEAEEYNDKDYDLSIVSDTTKSIYKNKYNYVWDNSSTDKRNEIINYACQFLGNPYRYGGTSLTNGIDCSAYCMRILQHFGIEIGRDSNTQYRESRGKQISAKDIQPGDLIYYSSNGGKTTYHVVMYLGDGKCINASCRKYGICISNINYSDICAIKNYID